MTSTEDFADVEAQLRNLHGSGERSAAGVLHVVATWRAPDGSLRVIRIGPRSPRSATDHFVLRAARMRADAIVTTGRILRDEPSLSHDELDPELLAWRRDRLMKPLPPQTVILTSGRNFDFGHRLLGASPAPLLVVPAANRERVLAAAKQAGVHCEVAGRDDLDLRAVLELLRDRGAGCVLVEAGPSTARDLYAGDLAVDELWLSVFEEDELDAQCIGGAFPDEARLETYFDFASEPVARQEQSGRWSFRRLWRERG